MRIIGFNLTKISIEKKENVQGKIQVNQNIDITDLTKEKMPISDEEMIKIHFNFTINYSEDFAKLEFSGNAIILPDKEEVKKFMKSWKDKQVPPEYRVFLFNFIMNKCNIKALSLEDELNLPFHLPLPKLDPNQQQ